MPPLGDTDGAGGSDAAGEAPQSVAFLPVISEPVERDQLHSNLSTTLRPLVERERRERGDEERKRPAIHFRGLENNTHTPSPFSPFDRGATGTRGVAIAHHLPRIRRKVRPVSSK